MPLTERTEDTEKEDEAMTKIFYFSGTGNSLAVAKHLVEDLGGELVPIAGSQRQGASVDADVIGIVFPVYSWGLPLVVAEFARNLKAPASAYVFAVTNCGGFPAGTLLQLEKILSAGGTKLSAGFSLRMPDNYLPLFKSPLPELIRKLTEAEPGRTAQIAAFVRERKQGRIEAGNFLSNAFFSGLIYKGFAKYVRGSDKAFLATDKCNSCGICASVCPAANIRIAGGRPEWQHKCEQCLACLHWCPTEAIEFGKNTVGKKRYHHPGITAKDFIRAPGPGKNG